MKKLDFRLVLVTDRRLARGRTHAEVVQAAVAGGATMVQLREKELGGRRFLEEAQALRQLLQGQEIPLIINDRLDIALAGGADGVHLGQEDLPLREARALAGEEMLIGISVNNLSQALEAERGGADYLGVGPIFTTPTKADTAPAIGLDTVRAIRQRVRLPLIGIGGINAGNAAAVIGAGCDGIAVVSALVAAEEIRAAAASLLAAIAGGAKP